ncbi:ETS-related transcription factor Elf-3-like isoform X2 [Palaemon carinicauda]|uniref:ETS-related transcription factor Elf-3-like isoform X2 n=1 Tax=Palaemon carinicauda TaxID=392227 RepID=UPI0035B67B03
MAFRSNDFSIHGSSVSGMFPLNAVAWPGAYIGEWTSEEVYQFFESLCSTYNILEASLENFRVSGCDLLQMSLEEYQRLDPINGSFFYNQVKSKRQDPSMRHTGSSLLSTPPSVYSYQSIPSPTALAEPQHDNNRAVGDVTSALQYHNPLEEGFTNLGLTNHHPLLEAGLPNPYHGYGVPLLRQEGEGCYDPMSLMPSQLYTIGQAGTPYPEQSSPSPNNAAPYSSDYEHLPSIDGTHYGGPSSPMYPEGHDISGTSSAESSPNPVSLLEDLGNFNFDGQPHSSQLQMDSQKTRKGAEQKSPRKDLGTAKKGRIRERGPKIYEFLWCRLRDPSTNPSIIRWESLEDRVFRLVNQAELSKRWGERRPSTKDENLPYEHFARAMRYHYNKNVFISVPDKKLVYSFGEKTFQSLSEKFGPPI